MTKQTRSIAIISGGANKNRDVSIETGEQLYYALKKINGISVVPVVISPGGEWSTMPEALAKTVDSAIVAIHGKLHERAMIAELLSEVGIKDLFYNEFDGMIRNKRTLYKFAHMIGVQTPRTYHIHTHFSDRLDSARDDLGGFPIVVKPAFGTGGMLVTIVRNNDELKKAVVHIEKVNKRLILQRFVHGKEFALSGFVINGSLDSFIALSCEGALGKVRDVPAVTSGAITYEPVTESEDIYERLKEVFVRIASSCETTGLLSMDIILADDGKLYVIDVDPIPEITKGSALAYVSNNKLLDITEGFHRAIESQYAD